jgi:hypothetical protein
MLTANLKRLSILQHRLGLHSQTRLLWVILIVSVLLRLGGAFYLGNDVENMPGTADQISYHTLAVRVMEGHGFSFGESWWPVTAPNAPTAHWSFLYTFYLVGVYSLFGIHPLAARLIQAVVVGLLHPTLAYLVARRLFVADETQTGEGARQVQWMPLLAAAITAVYAYFVYYATALMTEPFYITAVLLLMYLAMRLADSFAEKVKGHWPQLAVGMGVTLAVCILLRQLFMLFFPFLGLWLLWRGWQYRRLRATILSLAIVTGILFAAIAPFTIYNYNRFNRLVLLNTNSGYAFFFGNHPIYGTNFIGILPEEMGSYGDLIPKELRHLDEAALDQALLKEGLQIVADNPGRYVLLSMSRVREYFKFWPSAESGLISNVSRVFSFGVLLPFILYGLLRTLQHYRLSPAHGLIYLFMAFYTGIHLLTWTLIRYRLPVDAFLVMFATYGIAELILRLGKVQVTDRLLQNKQIGDPAA